jgi:hypothetical protein
MILFGQVDRDGKFFEDSQQGRLALAGKDGRFASVVSILPHASIQLMVSSRASGSRRALLRAFVGERAAQFASRKFLRGICFSDGFYESL